MKTIENHYNMPPDVHSECLHTIDAQNAVAAIKDAAQCTWEEAFQFWEDEDYTVITDGEADEAVNEAVADSLWAFNASFILNYIGIYTEEAEEALQKMQSSLCESANPLILAMIGGEDALPEFAEEAVRYDGRGHFLASYDNEEHEFKTHDGGLLYVYRQN